MSRVMTVTAITVLVPVLLAAAKKYENYPHLTVTELKKSNSTIDRKPIVVSGCYASDFEISLLFDCKEAQYVGKGMTWIGIWVDSVDSPATNRSPQGSPNLHRRRTSFKKAKWGEYSPVLLLGYYQTDGRYGHQDLYSSRFLVYDIISEGSAQKLPSKTADRHP